MPFGATHQLIVLIARSAVNTFFRTIEVHGLENVPEDVPIILSVHTVFHLIICLRMIAHAPMRTWLSM